MTFIIAELSGNHHQTLQTALDLVYAAKACGADAVKLQTLHPDRIAAPGVVIPSGPWAGRELRELYRETMLPWDWHPRIFDEGRELGIEVFSSPFDPQAVHFLQQLDCPRYKIASLEIADYPLIQAIAATGKPYLISDGLAEGPAFDRALTALGRGKATALRCVSEYPADPTDYRFWDVGMAFYGVPRWGVSDHSIGTTVPVAAAALKADVIEKHLCLSRAAGGPDSGFSSEPAEFAAMVQAVRSVERMVQAPQDRGSRKPSSHAWLGKSLWVVQDVEAGGSLSADNVRALRPHNGLDPWLWPEVEGRRFTQAVKAGTPLSEAMIGR